jgi:N-acetylneuraminic acid mutarotase
MKANNVFLELSLSKECEHIAKSQDISEYPAHLEIKILDSMFLSKTFNLSKFQDQPLMRIYLPDLDLPIQGRLHVVVKLFIHVFEHVSLLGLQDLLLDNKKFPLSSEFPITSKQTSERIYNLKFNLGSSAEAPEEVYRQKYPLGRLDYPSKPVLRSIIEDHASKISTSEEEGKGPKSAQHLLHGVALAVLKVTKDVFFYTEPVRHLHKDEFSSKILSRDYQFIHSPDAHFSKNIFMDLGHRRMLVLKSNVQNCLPKVYHSAVVLLPNGKYILAGGNSKDGVVSHHGVYYFDPILGEYTKISEIPFNLHKHEMHYTKGQITIFGGIDMKDDKGSHNSETTNFASTIYTLNLSTKQWTKGEKMNQKSNDRCPSIFYKGQYLINRGTDTCEALTPGAGPWKSLKVINKEKNSSLTMFQPSVFFTVNDQIHVCYKKSKEEQNNYIIARVNVTDKNVEVTHLADTELTSLSGTKVIRRPDDEGVIEDVYIYDQSDVRLFVFKNGAIDQKKSPTEKVKIDLVIDPSLNITNIGKSAENCGAGLVSTLDHLYERKIESAPVQLADSIKEDLLLSVHSGKRHCMVPLATGNNLILGYFEKIGEDKFRPKPEAYTMRTNTWTGTQTTILPIPTDPLNTVSHAVLQVKSTIFIVGGLHVLDPNVTFTSSELDNIHAKSGSMVPSRQILAYRPSNQSWKHIDLLPEGLYNCQLSSYQNFLIIIGGQNAAGDHSKKIWFFNLETYSLIDTELTIDLVLSKDQQLQTLSLGKNIIIGAKGHEKVIVCSLEDKRTYPVSCGIFDEKIFYSCEPTDSSLKSFSCLYVLDGSCKQHNKKIHVAEFLKLLESGKAEIKTYFEKSDSSVDLPENYQFRYVAASEGHDLYALDLVDHSKNFTDFSKKPTFAILSETKEHRVGYSLYNYSQDQIMNHKHELSFTETKGQDTEEYKKGLVKLAFHKNGVTCSLGNGTIMISGGQKADNGKLISTNKCWSFDPISKTYNELNKMKHARADHCLVKVGHHIYCFGGRAGQSGELLSSSERYDIVAGTWSLLKDMPCTLIRTAACSIFNKIYLIGGEGPNGEFSDKIFIYDIASDTYDHEPNYRKDLKLEKPLTSAVAISISFNTILLAGGVSQEGPNMNIYKLQFLEGYDKSQLKLAEVALYPHIGCQSIFIDGKAILIGGNGFNGSESYCLRGGFVQEMPQFRLKLHSTVQSIAEVKNQFYITDNFLHCNSQFRYLYLFGLDQKKEIWR